MEKLPHALDTLLQDGDVRRLFGVLRSGGAEGRLVGGCVRDALLGRPMTDIDVAVNRPPEVVHEILEGAGLRTIPTGLSHGTLTVLVGRLSIEITSLRRDIVTDGRHAEVAFTDQWEQDAARRDFTINALYCDEGGHIYDYFSGQKDLKTGKIRFIGVPQERIQEDFCASYVITVFSFVTEKAFTSLPTKLFESKLAIYTSSPQNASSRSFLKCSLILTQYPLSE